MFLGGYLWTVKSGELNRVFKTPKKGGRWWQYNKTKHLLIKSNTSGWDGAYVWEIDMNKITFKYAFVEEHSMERTTYLIENGVKRNISASVKEAYEKKTNAGKVLEMADNEYAWDAMKKPKILRKLRRLAGLIIYRNTGRNHTSIHSHS